MPPQTVTTSASSQGLGISFPIPVLPQQQGHLPIASPTRARTPHFQPTFSLRPTHTRGSSSLSSPGRSLHEPDKENEDDEATPLVSDRPLPSTGDAGSSRIGGLLSPRAASRAGSNASAGSGSTRKLVKKPSQSELSNRDGRAPSPTPGQRPGQFARLSDYDDTTADPRRPSIPYSTEESVYTEEIEATPRPQSTAGHSITSLDFPQPPTSRPAHQSQVSPEGFPPPLSSSPEEYRGPRVISQHIPRSTSVPVNLQPFPSYNTKPLHQQEKRTGANAISTGMHSKNVALMQAETGGTMLSYSPGQGAYRNSSPIVVPPAREKTAFPDDRRPPVQQITQDPISGRQRSLSDGASLLLRQGTLLHPQSSNKRASTELGILLGSKSSRRLSTGKLLPAPAEDALRQVEKLLREDGVGGMIGKNQRVGLEAKKKAKARIEVDVVLERDCVVEGGDVRGRLEVLVRGGKRGENVRVGAGKIRVLGFEDLAPPAQRHIFYHQSYPLPLFNHPPVLNGPTSSLFGSEPDDEGYRLAVEGCHFIPFSMRLPVGGGAKGTYTSPGGKGPCVRYVVVGSVKLHMPSTNKRSIAHFYRPVHLLPYLNPSIALAPAPYPIMASVERGLGWSLGGEKGKVELTARMARANWVSGQRIWCEVGVRNGSGRKIKSLNVALLQTVQVFAPESQSENAYGGGSIKGAQCLPLGSRGPWAPEYEERAPTTVRRKVSEEVLEADVTNKGAGRVTGKGWWTGVDAGGQGQWECSLQVPPGLVSIRRARLIEVSYVLRITVNGSIYVDLPITLINFLSIDPPPLFRTPGVQTAMERMPIDMAIQKTNPTTVDINDTFQRGFEVSVDYGAYQQQANRAVHTGSSPDYSIHNQSAPARASSTTLDLDQLLAAGRARADEARLSGKEFIRSRPASMTGSLASNYGGARSLEGPPSANVHGMAPMKRTRSTPALHTKESQVQSCISDAESILSRDEDDRDLRAAEARRRRGRQLSLAVIGQEAKEDQEDTIPNEGVTGSGDLTPRGVVFLPAGTPHGESIKMMQDTPLVPDVPQLSPTPIPAEICEDEEPIDVELAEHESVLDEIMSEDYERVLDDDFGHASDQIYGSEFEYDSETPTWSPPTRDMPSLGAEIDNGGDDNDTGREYQGEIGLTPDFSRDEHILQTMSNQDKCPASAMSPQSGAEEPEVGQVQQAVRRNVSLKDLRQTSSEFERRSSDASPSEVSADESPFDSPNKPSLATSMLRQTSQDSPKPLPELASPQSTRHGLDSGWSPVRESIATRGYPDSPTPSRRARTRLFDGSLSPPSGSKMPSSPGASLRNTTPSSMRRSESLQTQSQWELERGRTEEQNDMPELARSVAGDSASSEGEGLESPQLDILTPLVSPLTGGIRSPGSRSLPRVSSIKSNGSPQTSSGGSSRVSWSPSAALIRSQSIFGNAAKVPYVQAPPRGPRAQRPLSGMSQELEMPVPLSPTESMASSEHSVLPSVRSKIAQLESRDHALREFTNIALLQQTAPSPQRRSYTAALGRTSRQSSYDEEDSFKRPSRYSPRRQITATYNSHQGQYPEGAYEPIRTRKVSDQMVSINSTSTTATTVNQIVRDVSLTSHQAYRGLPQGLTLPTVYMAARSDDESSEGLL